MKSPLWVFRSRLLRPRTSGCIRQQTVSRWCGLKDPPYPDRIMRGSIRAAGLIEPEERDYQQPIVPAGRYGTIVVDPPWDMQKIEREVRPNQAGFDYPTMTADELAEPATKWVGETEKHHYPT